MKSCSHVMHFSKNALRHFEREYAIEIFHQDLSMEALVIYVEEFEFFLSSGEVDYLLNFRTDMRHLPGDIPPAHGWNKLPIPRPLRDSGLETKH